jgi:hypothetical protein
MINFPSLYEPGALQFMKYSSTEPSDVNFEVFLRRYSFPALFEDPFKVHEFPWSHYSIDPIHQELNPVG